MHDAWEEVVEEDPDSGEMYAYYFNHVTEASVWEPPQGWLDQQARELGITSTGNGSGAGAGAGVGGGSSGGGDSAREGGEKNEVGAEVEAGGKEGNVSSQHVATATPVAATPTTGNLNASAFLDDGWSDSEEEG